MSDGDRALSGATVQRIDVGPEVALLRVRAPGETWFVILAAGRRGGIGIAADKPWRGAGLPGGAVAEGEKRRFRSRIEGAELVAIGARAVVVQREGAAIAIEAQAEDGARITLRSEAAAPVEARAIEALIAEGSRLVAELGDAAIEGRRLDASRAIAKARSRLARRIEAVRGDLDRIGEADELASRAALFVAEAARAPRGARRLAVTDWSSGEAREIEIALDPGRSAREQIEQTFKRARRLKLGRSIAEARLADASRARAALDALAPRIAAASTLADIEAIVVEARAAAPRDFALGEGASPAGFSRARGPSKTPAKAPFRAFAAADGARILVGRGAAHNDALTLHVARPHDLWLHAKGRAGAHVIVPLDKGEACPSDRLVDAAHLAAHFSDARDEGIVEVQHVPRRHVRKPKGSAPGFVIVEREKVIVLRIEPSRLARLLAAEAP